MSPESPASFVGILPAVFSLFGRFTTLRTLFKSFKSLEVLPPVPASLLPFLSLSGPMLPVLALASGSARSRGLVSGEAADSARPRALMSGEEEAVSARSRGLVSGEGAVSTRPRGLVLGEEAVSARPRGLVSGAVSKRPRLLFGRSLELTLSSGKSLEDKGSLLNNLRASALLPLDAAGLNSCVGEARGAVEVASHLLDLSFVGLRAFFVGAFLIAPGANC